MTITGGESFSKGRLESNPACICQAKNSTLIRSLPQWNLTCKENATLRCPILPLTSGAPWEFLAQDQHQAYRMGTPKLPSRGTQSPCSTARVTRRRQQIHAHHAQLLCQIYIRAVRHKLAEQRETWHRRVPLHSGLVPGHLFPINRHPNRMPLGSDDRRCPWVLIRRFAAATLLLPAKCEHDPPKRGGFKEPHLGILSSTLLLSDTCRPDQPEAKYPCSSHSLQERPFPQ